MFHLNDYRTVRFLVDDHHHTYRPTPRRFLRRQARADRAVRADRATGHSGR